MPYRVAVVSAQEVVARGLVAMLSDYPDRLVVTALSGTRSAARGVDVILYDSFGLRHQHEGDLVHLVEETDAAIVILGRPGRPDLQSRGIELGGVAWVPMSLRAVELVAIIEDVAQGRTPVIDTVDEAEASGLTVRETEVLVLIAQGLSNTAIAQRMFVSDNTLKSHIRRLYKKIGATSRTQAVLWAAAQNLIDNG
jgi:DNA-binding NarL/FixJ family response regulator